MKSNQRLFISWLKGEMKKRGWGVSKTARSAGVSHATISYILSGKQQASWAVCDALAKAFEIPSDFVLKMAGHLPETDPDETEPEIELSYRQLWLSLIDNTPLNEILEMVDVVRTLKEAKAKYKV